MKFFKLPISANPEGPKNDATTLEVIIAEITLTPTIIAL
jgi:hypothetical protein